MARQLSFAVVCSSNQNRSMEAHHFMSKKGLKVKSFGIGKEVKLPGASPDKPNTYSFDTTYDDIYKDLVKKDKAVYTQNGILHMLERNKRIKSKPERFQDASDRFDVVFSAEERVYDQIVEDLESRDKENSDMVHIINIDIQDNHEEATLGAFLFYELALILQETDDLDNDIDELLHDYESKIARPILHTVCFY